MKTIPTLLAALLLWGPFTAFAESAPSRESDTSGVVPAYLHIQKRLAADDLAGSKKAAATLGRLLDNDSLNALAAPAESLSNAENMDAARAAFHKLSDALVAQLKQDGLKADTTLYRVHCPMAFEGEGADWIQADKNVSNPYYGAKMARCGAVKKKITGTDADDRNTPEPHSGMHHGHH